MKTQKLQTDFKTGYRQPSPDERILIARILSNNKYTKAPSQLLPFLLFILFFILATIVSIGFYTNVVNINDTARKIVAFIYFGMFASIGFMFLSYSFNKQRNMYRRLLLSNYVVMDCTCVNSYKTTYTDLNGYTYNIGKTYLQNTTGETSIQHFDIPIISILNNDKSAILVKWGTECLVITESSIKQLNNKKLDRDI